MSTPASFESTPATSTVPNWYPDLLASVAHQIDSGRARAVSAANRELVRAYWSIGCELLARVAGRLGIQSGDSAIGGPQGTVS